MKQAGEQQNQMKCNSDETKKGSKALTLVLTFGSGSNRGPMASSTIRSNPHETRPVTWNTHAAIHIGWDTRADSPKKSSG